MGFERQLDGHDSSNNSINMSEGAFKTEPLECGEAGMLRNPRLCSLQEMCHAPAFIRPPLSRTASWRPPSPRPEKWEQQGMHFLQQLKKFKTQPKRAPSPTSKDLPTSSEAVLSIWTHYLSPKLWVSLKNPCSS